MSSQNNFANILNIFWLEVAFSLGKKLLYIKIKFDSFVVYNI